MDTVEHAEMVEKELNAFIECRSRKGDVDPDEESALWKASVRAHNARIREENKAAWREHHQQQAACLRATLEALIARHEEQAAKLMDVPEHKRKES